MITITGITDLLGKKKKRFLRVDIELCHHKSDLFYSKLIHVTKAALSKARFEKRR